MIENFPYVGSLIRYGMVKHDLNLRKRWKYVLFHDVVIYIKRPAFYIEPEIFCKTSFEDNMYFYYKNFTTEFYWIKLWQYGFWLLVRTNFNSLLLIKTNFQLLVVVLYNLILVWTNLMNTFYWVFTVSKIFLQFLRAFYNHII